MALACKHRESFTNESKKSVRLDASVFNSVPDCSRLLSLITVCSLQLQPPLRLLKHQLRPLPSPDWQPDVELAAGERRCRPHLRDQPGTPAAELRGVPDAGNPEVEGIALWGTTTSSSSESVPSQAAVQNSHDEAHANMHPSPGLVCSHRPEGRVLSRLDSTSTQTLPTVCFEGRAYQYKVLPFGLSLSPRVFTKVTEAALSPLWRRGIRILNYLDDWLLIAHSRDVLCEHRDLVLRHLSHLGLQVNREKSKLSPVQRISFLGVELDSVNMTARLTNERAQSVLNCLNSFRHKTAVPLKTFQRLLGHMAAAATVTPLTLLHMRPLQHWLHDRVPRWAWHRGTLRIGVSLQCRRLFSPWSDPAFLQAGVPLGQVSRHLVVYTDASSTGWGAVCNGQAASGSWTGPRLQWHINCLELLAVLLALRCFRQMLRHKHVLVRTDSTATVAYINHQGGLRSRSMSQLTCHLLLWSQTWLKLLCAVHIPGELNRAADQLSRQSTHPGEWRLHPQRGSPRQGCAGTQLASGAQVRLSPSEPPCTDTVQDQGGRGAGSAGCAILAHPDLVSRPHFPCGSPSLEDPLEERPSFSGDGHNLAPASRPMEPARLAPGRDTSDLSGLSQASRAPSTRQAYALRWGLFVDWCSSRGEDPQRCPIAVVLSFLQEKLERRLSPSTLKVYVAAIAAYHDAVDGASLGKHQLIVRFLRGARRVNPPRPHLVPSWDLSVTLQGLREAPFEPLASVELKHLSLKTALLTALATIKRVGDLQAFSVDEACLEFWPGDSLVILRPRPGYVPKVPTTPFRDQVVNLQALCPEADPASALLCPVRALRIYVDRTRHFRHSEQLFVCFGGQQKGNAVSKQRLAHWVVDAISLSYKNQGEPCPLGVRAHSTRSVASSYALAHGASLANICRAAGWVTPNTFAWFYNLRVEAVSSRVLR
ncbi:ORF V: Enzymatic polyprotein [Labeo rohita]|uniref:ribonuclease H n=1 Tax=Labeo rohita TaxID=84645 RepID=A0ABQ8LBC1_LABRO|nr:ORF V: Enzymatic polyprotein [Labeo rohita]